MTKPRQRATDALNWLLGVFAGAVLTTMLHPLAVALSAILAAVITIAYAIYRDEP